MRSKVCISRLGPPFDDYVVIGFPRHRPSSFANLTQAELAVTEGLLDGATMEEIARGREVSTRTVEHQVESAYRKLGVSSRLELVALVSRSLPRGPRS